MQTNKSKNKFTPFVRVLKNSIILAIVAFCFSFSSSAQVGSSRPCSELFLNENYVKAIDCFSEYLKVNPRDADALHYRALCYYAVSEYIAAFADVNEAIRRRNRKSASSMDDLYHTRAMFYAAIENYDEALKDYARALKANSKKTDVLFDRANLYYNLDNYSASDADCQIRQ